MSVNSSSSNDSDLPPHPFFIPENLQCIMFSPGLYVFITFNFTYILLLLPLCVFILHHGLQQWRQKRSASSAATMSHSDCFTYHTVVMELIGICGCLLCFCGICRKDINMINAGNYVLYFPWFGETFFHLLTCVERHLAVVHPITYLSLRNQRGIRIRNISIACVWLLSFVKTVTIIMTSVSVVVDLFLLISALILISLCSLSVLCVLIRPGPGEHGGGRARVNQSNLRAFYSIMAILGVLLLRFTGNLAWSLMILLKRKWECGIMACSLWFNLPSSLVLPLLFLHRAGKLMCWKKNIQ